MMFLDDNGEPAVIIHVTTAERKDKVMTKDELHYFGVELVARLYEKQGLKLIDINRIIGKEYPQFVMKSQNKKLYYVAAAVASFPTKCEELYNRNKNEFPEIMELAKEFNASPCFIGISIANATEQEMSALICGSGYYVAFSELHSLIH